MGLRALRRRYGVIVSGLGDLRRVFRAERRGYLSIEKIVVIVRARENGIKSLAVHRSTTNIELIGLSEIEKIL